MLSGEVLLTGKVKAELLGSLIPSRNDFFQWYKEIHITFLLNKKVQNPNWVGPMFDCVLFQSYSNALKTNET